MYCIYKIIFIFCLSSIPFLLSLKIAIIDLKCDRYAEHGEGNYKKKYELDVN